MSVTAGAALIVTVIFPVTVTGVAEESEALIVSEEVTAVVGMPLKVHPFRVSPAGTVPPASEQVYGAVPPRTPIVPL